jgi:hypothetical protein
MFSKLMIAAIAVYATTVEPGLAQQTNLASIKCAEFLGMDQQSATRALVWLQGYYTYEDDPVVIDMDKEKSKEAQIKQYCADHKDIDLIDASAIFMDKKYND